MLMNSTRTVCLCFRATEARHSGYKCLKPSRNRLTSLYFTKSDFTSFSKGSISVFGFWMKFHFKICQSVVIISMTNQFPRLFWLNYSVVSIKRTGCNKRTGWSKNFIQYMKKQSGWCKNFIQYMKKTIRVVKSFKIVKRSCSLNRYYRVLL